MPYNFEMANGTVYIGNTPVPGLGYLDSALGGTYTGAIFDPGSSYFIGNSLPSIPNISLPNINLGGLANMGAGIGGSFAGAAAGSLLATTIGPALVLGLGYMVAKKQKWI